MLKLSTSLLALVSATQASTCITCEHIGFAASEADALAVMGADGTTATDNFCVSGGANNPGTTWGSVTASYCVAQFFIYEAKDMAADTTTKSKA